MKGPIKDVRVATIRAERSRAVLADEDDDEFMRFFHKKKLSLPM
jgi:hypothetical protein